MLNLNHKKLEVWEMSISFVAMIYELTKEFPKSEIYGITNQLRRAAASIPSNLAEGASRDSAKDRKRFMKLLDLQLLRLILNLR